MTARVDPSPRWTERLDALLRTVIARRTPGFTLERLERHLVAASPWRSRPACCSATHPPVRWPSFDQRCRRTGTCFAVPAARKLFGARSAVGRRFVLDMRAPRPMEVVGVVHDVRFTSVEAASSPALYLLAGEEAHAPRLNAMWFVRTTPPPDAALQAFSRVVRDDNTPLSVVKTPARARCLAGELVLGTVRRSVWLVGGGVTAGLFAAIAGARLLGAFLYGIGTFDLATDVGVVVVVATLGVLATFIPARRITRIDPAAILKA